MAEQDEMWLDLPTGMEHVTRFNTELWRYLGQSATLGDHSVYNHIRITSTDEESGEEEGMAIVFADNDNFDSLSRFMLRWNYPQHFNLARVTPFVQYSFDVTHGIDEDEMTFPARWLGPMPHAAPEEDEEDEDGD